MCLKGHRHFLFVHDSSARDAAITSVDFLLVGADVRLSELVASVFWVQPLRLALLLGLFAEDDESAPTTDAWEPAPLTQRMIPLAMCRGSSNGKLRMRILDMLMRGSIGRGAELSFRRIPGLDS